MPVTNSPNQPEQAELIRLSGISFSFGGEKPLFEELDFSLRQGERLALVGDNGAGKTTLMRIIMGLARPLKGSVRLFGQDCRSEKDFASARVRIGFVFQDAEDQLFCPTVEEDVAFGPLNLGLPHDLVRERTRAALEEVGLAGFERRASCRLSGGEKKLAALATALSMKPELLLLDEPTAGLSTGATERIARLLRANALPCLIASHDRDFLRLSAARTLHLQAGRIRYSSST